MARVDHKKIKQLIAQKKKTVTDRQLFTSRAMATHFEDMAAAQTRRYGYKRRVKVQLVWNPKNGQSAATNQNRIWINAGHPSVTILKTRQERYEEICAKFAHELGHVLYTDFLTSQTYHARQAVRKWFPDRPPLRDKAEHSAEADLWDYAKSDPKHLSMLSHVSHEILNVLEDGYIEQRMISEYPGVLGSCLLARQPRSFDLLPTVTQMAEAEDNGGHIWQTILQNILSYMLWGWIKYGETPLSDPRIQVVFSMLSELDQALISHDFRDRCRVTNLILIRCWPDIRDFLEECEEKASDAAAAGASFGASSEELIKALAAGLIGGSAEGSGSTEPVPGAGAPTGGMPLEKSRAATAALAAKSLEEEVPEPEENPEEEKPAAEPEAASESENEDGEFPEVLGEGEPLPGEGKNSALHQPVSREEMPRAPLENTDSVSVPEDGTTEWDGDYAGTGYSGAASDIERVLEEMSENAVCSELERQRTKELTELAQSISYGDIHKGVSITVHRMPEVTEEMREQYREISGELLRISKQLQRSVLQQLKDSRRGGKQTGLLMGRKLDSHALFRRDGHVFCKNALPVETPELCLAILVDESGSMCIGDRATYARMTAIILYLFCQALGIPVMVYGHSANAGVDLYSYAEFEVIDRDDRYRMMDISARANNRDGAAVRYVAERLCSRHEDVKMLMLVSDGQPLDSGYYGTAAEEDLRGIRQEYQRKGVLFVAAAIGSDKENIERIYGNSFLDITDLNKLPVKLAGIIKRFLRV